MLFVTLVTSFAAKKDVELIRAFFFSIENLEKHCFMVARLIMNGFHFYVDPSSFKHCATRRWLFCSFYKTVPPYARFGAMRSVSSLARVLFLFRLYLCRFVHEKTLSSVLSYLSFPSAWQSLSHAP